MAEELEDRGDVFDDEELEDNETEELEEDEEDESQEDESGNDDDEDDSGSEEESEDDEEDEEPPAPTKAKEPRIPKSRLDEANAQRDEYRDRMLWLEEQLEKLIDSPGTKSTKDDSKDAVAPKEVYDFDKAEEDYANLLISGEVGQASKLRSEINKARHAEMLELVSSITETATNKAKNESSLEKQNEKFEIAISSMERKYKFLDSKAKEYNEEAVETVNTLLSGYLAGGKLTKAEALAKAVEKAVPLYIKPEKEVKEKLGSSRSKDAGKKAADAAARQPVKTKSSSTKNIDLEAVKVSKMSEKAFGQLTEKEKRILRGD